MSLLPKFIVNIGRKLRLIRHETTSEIAAEFSSMANRFKAAEERSLKAVRHLEVALHFHKAEVAAANVAASNLTLITTTPLATK